MPTRKEIDQFYASIYPGTVIQCAENTLIPERIGVTGTVAEVMKGALTVTTADIPKLRPNERYWIYKPKRVSDVLQVTDDTITYRIDPQKLGDHYATWKIVR